MRAYEIRGGGLDGLALVDRPDPPLAPGQVRVRVRAASLNYRDLKVAEQVTRTIVPLSDGAGDVIEVGPRVTAVRPGDRVAGSFFQGWVDGPFDPAVRRTSLGGGRDGVLAERVVLEEQGAVRYPEAYGYEEAATLPCAALTAWVGLVEYGAIQRGQTVLAMGTGGVSIFALQLAKALGGRVILTSSRDDKLERGKALGADEQINYVATPNWDERARALTGGAGVDHILEVGGEGTMPRSLSATRDGGHVSIVGLLTGSFPDLARAQQNGRGIRVDFVVVGSVRHFEAMNAALSQHRIRPVIDRVFPFSDARRAYEYLQGGRHFGKIVIRVDE
jgi:NADPH:quinone reductase-like Zn-dependent oxidoreductase